jgi:hypothetical protein
MGSNFINGVQNGEEIYKNVSNISLSLKCQGKPIHEENE